MAKLDKFPSETEVTRLRQYSQYEKLLEGNHYTAYMSEIGDKFSDRYKYLRYMTCNFAGLISKVMADVLFGEKVIIESAVKDTKEQEFIDELMYQNKLDTQFYESSLLNSARGDALLRIRVEDNQIKIEDINPAMYFPELSNNFRSEPKKVTLAWKEYQNDKSGETVYLIKEIYTEGVIETEVYEMKDRESQEIIKKVPVKVYNELAGTEYEQKIATGIEKIPLVHIPNYRVNNKFWGSSDYLDLESLFFALNNRMTSIDNILDKHSDPILSVPPGVLDENGEVRKEKLNMIETQDGEGKPEYIVWNANLDIAFKQIDEIVKMIFLMGEISPDVVGLDTGRTAAESGRALKLRMLRTLAKKNRKALYYEQGIQKAVEIASLFAKTGALVGEIKYKGDKIIPNITFADGVVDDKVEEVTNESLKLASGITSKKRAIKVIEDMDDEQADALIAEIKKEDNTSADISDETFHLMARTNDGQEPNKESKTS
jgi:hypothetical protein